MAIENFPAGMQEESPAGESPEREQVGKIPTALAAISRAAYAHAKTAGVQLDPLLRTVHLTREQIENPQIRLKVHTQIDFLNLISKALKDELLGFHLALTPDLREMGLCYYVLASSETLIDALRRVARYASIVNEGIRPECIDKNEGVGLALHYWGVSRHLDTHQIEYWMTGIVRICRQLTGLRLMPNLVELMHFREGRCAEFFEFFGDRVKFGSNVDAITFERKARNLAVLNADRYLNKLLIGYCEEALEQRKVKPGSFQSSVENVVVPLLPHGEAGVDEISRRLGVSRRTLTRRLSAEGLTFSQIVADLRLSLAQRYLNDDNLPISEVAWLLGYGEVSNFSHAFKRWTGKTPSEWRTH